MRRALALLVFAVACIDFSGPSVAVLENKVPFPRADTLLARWERLESCSGITRDFSRTSFYTATSITWNGNPHGGIWLSPNNEIVVLVDAPSLMVDHEIMHALLGHGGHPRAYFHGVCGDLLNVWGAR